MKARRLLVVEDDADTLELLRMYFSEHGFDVSVAVRGPEALSAARQSLPDLVLLDINLPEMNGLEVCAALRAAPRTAHIPIIFISERDSQSDRLTGLSAGAVDYVSKPFDLEELRLRVLAAIKRAERDNLLDPRTGLPTGRLVDEQIAAVQVLPGWQVLECRLESFSPFVDVNGFAAGDDVLKFAAQVLREVINTHGGPDDFIGHPANDTFVVLTGAADSEGLAAMLRARFDEGVKAHYSFMDVEQGYIVIRDGDGALTHAPLMTLSVNVK
ncbi:MAG: response regulator [Anaerolineales bacterium]|nr:response regulator [Anaerolineales bacterium]